MRFLTQSYNYNQETAIDATSNKFSVV